MTIEELRNAAAAINDAADWLSRQFSGESEEAEPAPAKEPELKLEDVRTVLADMSRTKPYVRDTRPASEVRCRQALRC